MNKRIIIPAIIVAAVAATILTGCESDSTVASKNISTEAEQFRIQREIVFYNGVTDKYIAVVTGRCSVDGGGTGLPGKTLAVTCKVGNDQYIKDDFGLSDNTTWFELQQKPVPVDVYHTEVVFKPASVIPYLNVETGKNGATGNDGGSDFTSTDEYNVTTTAPNGVQAPKPTPIPSPAG